VPTIGVYLNRKENVQYSFHGALSVSGAKFLYDGDILNRIPNFLLIAVLDQIT
jgi:hypothetical protein